MNILGHLLALIVLIVLPIISFKKVKKLKEVTANNSKGNLYFSIIIWNWSIAILAFIVFPARTIFFASGEFPFSWIWYIVAVILFMYFLVVQFLPVLLINTSSRFREGAAGAFDNNKHIYPITTQQRTLFIMVPITVGICEEIIFRGYLYQYFQNSPYGLSAILSFLIVGLIFGAGHFSQGISGIVEALILGYLLGLIYLITGNLLLPIILHIIFDFKILYISYVLSKTQNKSG